MTNLTTGELAAGLHRLGDTVTLTPADAPMTEPALVAWLTLRGATAVDMPDLVAEYRGRTEDEMDAVYRTIHGD